MIKKFLGDAVAIIAGKQSESIADLLNTRKHVNEFIIAKKLGITINQARNILYKISDYGLVSNIRKKDKKKGWYTYFWRLESLKSLEFLKNILEKKIEQTNSQIKSRETKDFYICERCDIEFSEENALLNDFTCKECGNIFTVKEKNKVLKELKREYDKLRRELKLVEIEIEKEKEKVEKEKAKEIKEVKKEKGKKAKKPVKKPKKKAKKKKKKSRVKKQKKKLKKNKGKVKKKIKKRRKK